jgi:hypothetical protein
MSRINKRVTNCHMITLMDILLLNLQCAQTFNLSSLTVFLFSFNILALLSIPIIFLLID